jgi:hypothetical protein
MPSRKLPNSTPTVRRTLQAAHDEWKRTPVAANRALSPEQWAQLDDTDPNAVFTRFCQQADVVDAALAAQAPISDALAQTAGKLAMHVSHFHQVFDLGVARGVFQAGARSYYQRAVNATTIPDLSSYDAIAEEAANVVKGEAARAAAESHPVTFDSGVAYDAGVRFDSVTGFVSMTLPSAGEVGALLAQFKTQRDESNEVQVATDAQREALQTIYADALALAVDICDTVEFFYRKDPDDSSRRAKCERWGVVYVSDAAPAAPPPTPTPTPPQPAT